MPIGLRIDVDTFRGTRDGIPRLCGILARYGVRATWYFTVGPDNMGRHLRRLIRPAFAIKMLRSRATSLYGWDILLRGTLWPGPEIGRRLADAIRRPVEEGHELGLHAWDHHRWQVGVDHLPAEALRSEIDRAWDRLVEITGRPPLTSAAPGWRCTDAALRSKAARPFAFNSDCRGPAVPFLPEVNGSVIEQPQVPVDLPTYDEVVGRGGVDDERWNELLLERLRDGQHHVLTIHAESEGGSKANLFERFLDRALAEGFRFLPLGEWLAQAGPPQPGRIVRGTVPGREGWLAIARPEGAG
jgi:undecaprenyl phosphate-alpha-L-ara4FN deformylase